MVTGARSRPDQLMFAAGSRASLSSLFRAVVLQRMSSRVLLPGSPPSAIMSPGRQKPVHPDKAGRRRALGFRTTLAAFEEVAEDDVLAVLGGCDRVSRVKLVRRGNVDGVDMGARAEILDTLVDLGADLAGELVPSLLTDVGRRGNFEAGVAERRGEQRAAC